MKPTDLRSILQYIPRFREKVFILAIDGEVVEDENFANILLDVAVLRSLNIKVVLIHGASYQIMKLAESSNVPISNADGSGVTDATTLKLALTAANRITHEILEGLSSSDLRAAYPNCIVAHPLGIIHGVDHLLTGKVERVDVELLNMMLDKGIVPVIPPLGFDGDGKTYRVNSDSIALAVAEALKSIKLIYITNTDGIYSKEGLLRQMQASALEEMYKTRRSDFDAQIASKIEHAIKACKQGVSRVHIINGKVDEGLLAEVFSNEGIGTLIYANEYQQIRKAFKKDTRSIISLIQQSVQSDELVKRTRVSIEKQINDYYVFETDRNIVGCVAVHPYPEQRKAELACLYVKPTHENQGIGRKLIQFAENIAREKGFDEIFALSTQAFEFFKQKAGYVEGTIEDLPNGRREKYDQSGRKSKILIKKVGSESSLKVNRSTPELELDSTRKESKLPPEVK